MPKVHTSVQFMKEKLKIAFYTDSFLPAHDGVVSSIMALRKGLESKGHEVYIFASGNDATRKMVGHDRHIIIVKGMKFRKYPQYNIALLPFSTSFKLNRIRPDVIHAHTPFVMGTWALVAAKINGTPVVGTFHTIFMDRSAVEQYASKVAAGAIAKYAWEYARFFYNRCDAVIAPSESTKEILESKGVRNVCVAPNGVDTERFNDHARGKAVRSRLLQNPRQKIVLYVGRMSREKKIEVLLRAARLLKDENIFFVFVGAGPAIGHYKRQSERLGISGKVKFVGFVEDAQLPSYYAAADLFCIPSTFETQGMVAIEAMAVGKPVVGADSLALKEVIKSGRNGEKFRPGDSRDCAAKIKKAINNLTSYKEMAKTANEYSVNRTTDGVLNVYYKVLRAAGQYGYDIAKGAGATRQNLKAIH